MSTENMILLIFSMITLFGSIVFFLKAISEKKKKFEEDEAKRVIILRGNHILLFMKKNGYEKMAQESQLFLLEYFPDFVLEEFKKDS